MPPAKKRTATSAQDWKSSNAHEVEVPSGNVALVRRKGMQAFLKKGMIPNSLMPIVQKAIKSGDFDMKEGLENLDEKMLQDIMDMYDTVVVECVVQPKVTAVPTDDEGNALPYDQREEGLLYVDEVDFEDKVFLFQWVVGGTKDLEQFRQQQSAAVDNVLASKGVVAPPLNNPGNDG